MEHERQGHMAGPLENLNFTYLLFTKASTYFLHVFEGNILVLRPNRMFNLPWRVLERRNVDVGGKLSCGTFAFGEFVGLEDHNLVGIDLDDRDGKALSDP